MTKTTMLKIIVTMTDDDSMILVIVGVLSPVNHKGLYQGWKQTSV